MDNKYKRMPFFHGRIEVNLDIELMALTGIDEIVYLLNFDMEVQRKIICSELRGHPKRAKFSHDGRFLLIGSINAVAIYDLYDNSGRIAFVDFNKKDGAIVDFRLVHNVLYIVYPEKMVEYRILSYYEFRKELLTETKKKIYWCADDVQYILYNDSELSIVNSITRDVKIITFTFPIMMNTIVCYGHTLAYFMNKETLFVADFDNGIIQMFNEHVSSEHGVNERIFNVNFTKTGNLVLNCSESINIFYPADKGMKKISNIGPTLANIEEVGNNVISLCYGDLFVYS